MNYICSNCGKEFSIDSIYYLCDECGKNWHPGEKLNGVLQIKYSDKDKIIIKKDLDIKNFFPFNDTDLPNISVGGTLFYFSQKLS